MKAYLQQNVTGTYWSNVTPIDCPRQYAELLVHRLNEAEEARGSKARYRVSLDGREYNPLAIAKVFAQ